MKARIESAVGLGTTQDIDVEPTLRVEELKERLSAMQAVDKGHIALIYRGKPMPDGKTLKELGFTDGEKILVSPKSNEGGASLPPSFISARIQFESMNNKKNHIPLKPKTPYIWEGPIQGVGKWSGKTYYVMIELLNGYPYAPPLVKFITVPDSHPNIETDGSICLSLLRPWGWQPTYSMVTVYWALQNLLANPNYASPVLSYSLKKLGGVVDGLRSRR